MKKRLKEEEEEVDEDDDEADDDEVGDEINNAYQKLRDGPLKDKEAENVKVEAAASGSISPAHVTEEDNSTCDSLYQVPPAPAAPPLAPPTLVDMRNHYQQLYPGYPMMNPEMYQQRTFRPFPSADLGPAASGSQQNY